MSETTIRYSPKVRMRRVRLVPDNQDRHQFILWGAAIIPDRRDA